MFRALLALGLMVVSASSAHAQPKKEKIAILGLEIGGNLDAESTKVANALTAQLRVQPKAGKGPYQLAPNSEKEGIDERIAAGCEADEKENKCMAGIGKAMGADYLIWGKIERRSQGKEAGYQVKLTLLNVKTPNNPQHHSDFIPLAESLDARVGDWARKFYKALTGFNDGGTLVIKVNTDRGTILVENEERGNITNNRGEVPDLAAGKYRVAVVAEGFQRWESAEKVTISNGQTQTLDVTLVPTVVKDCDPKTSLSCETALPDPPKKKIWKVMTAVGAVVAVGGAVFWGVSFGKLDDIEQSLCSGRHKNDAGCMVSPDLNVAQALKDGDKQSRNTAIGIAGFAGGLAIAAIGIGGIVLGGGKEKAAAGSSTVSRRAKAGREYVLIPVVSPESAGATLRFRW